MFTGELENVILRIEEGSQKIPMAKGRSPGPSPFGKIDKVVERNWWELMPKKIDLVLGDSRAGETVHVSLGVKNLGNVSQISQIKHLMKGVLGSMKVTQRREFFHTFDIEKEDEERFINDPPIDHVASIFLFSQIEHDTMRTDGLFFRIYFLNQEGELFCPITNRGFTRRAQFNWEKGVEERGLSLVAIQQSDGYKFGRILLQKEGAQRRATM